MARDAERSNWNDHDHTARITIKYYIFFHVAKVFGAMTRSIRSSWVPFSVDSTITYIYCFVIMIAAEYARYSASKQIAHASRSQIHFRNRILWLVAVNAPSTRPFSICLFSENRFTDTHSSSSSNKQTQTSGRRHHGDRSRAQQQLSCDARCYWSITLFTFHAMAERRLIFDHCSIIESHTSNTWASREYARRRWLYRFLARTWSIVV